MGKLIVIEGTDGSGKSTQFKLLTQRLEAENHRVAGEEQLAARAESYRIQLDTYAYALRRIFGLPVRERILYFLRPGRSVTL